MRISTVLALLSVLVASPAAADPQTWTLEGWKTDFNNPRR